MQAISKRPLLPFPLAKPLSFAPKGLQGKIAAQILNRLFVSERMEGELDFLLGRRIQIQVEDVDNGFTLGCNDAGFFDAAKAGPADLTISGALYDFLLLISGREDPDTLFFQRRLSMQGDTELGVYLKNFLAAVDPATLPLGAIFQPALQRGLGLFERLAP
jgi:predicted lipid carrier protein YhbT